MLKTPPVASCHNCSYYEGQAKSAAALYQEQLLRADLLRQQKSALEDEVRKLRRELVRIADEHAVATRRIANLMQQGSAA
jgi:hypothetical protein